MDFDKPTERRGTLCSKWDEACNRYNIPEDGLPMWVADTDFEVPECVTRALGDMVDHRIHGYMGSYGPYKSAVQWWMKNRHGWEVDADAILTTYGLVNGIAIALEAFTRPGDRIVVFTPVYHAFMRIIEAAGREVVEIPLGVDAEGRFALDLEAAGQALRGDEKMLIWCSPHNPGGRIWSRDELAGLADFVRARDMLLISDEVHQDIILPGAPRHMPMALLDGIEDRLIMMSATSKVFNLAGFHSGNVIIPDEKLRATYQAKMSGLGIATNSAGIIAATAAYSPEGAEYADALGAYLSDNFKVFAEGVTAIPGLKIMPMEATYLAWVDFRGLGMDQDEIQNRIEVRAGIAANRGPTFGAGGEGFMRFNLGTQRARVIEAVERLQAAFSDLQ